MTTGDLHGNLERLRVQLQSIQYPHAFDVQGLKEGKPACILPLVHYALLGYSRHLARFLSTNGYELWAKSDLRFMESTLKFLRQEFNYRSALTMGQLFARGYAERKLLFLCDVIQMSKRKHNELFKLVHEKRHIQKVNHNAANMATTRRACEGACATSSPFLETKPWDRTLRMPEEVSTVDATTVPAARSDLAAESTTVELEPKFHPRKISLETNMDNNEILEALTAAEQEPLIVSDMPSPKTAQPDGDDLNQNTHDYLRKDPPPPSSESLSALHDDHKHYLLQAQPPPSCRPLRASVDYEHHHLLQSQRPPSSEPMNASHDDDHHTSLQAQPPPSSRPLSVTHDDDRNYLLQAQPSPSSVPSSASHVNDHQEQNIVQDFHEELCQKIMEMADRLEARFCTLEDGIIKARETLQEKLVSLEGRVNLLEAVMPHQGIELDSARRQLQQHHGSLNYHESGIGNFDRKHQQNFLPRQAVQPAHQVSSGWQENGFDIARWQLHMERTSEHSTPRATFQENLQNCECEQILWIPHQMRPTPFLEVNPYFNMPNRRHPCGASMPMPALDQHSQTIRDISNTHQYMENNLSKSRGESNENLFQVSEKVHHAYPEKKPLSTQDIVADIQSRFNRTMEMLYQDGQV